MTYGLIILVLLVVIFFIVVPGSRNNYVSDSQNINCSPSNPCPPGQDCIQGECTTLRKPPCSTTNPCPSDQTCIRGSCQYLCGEGRPECPDQKPRCYL